MFIFNLEIYSTESNTENLQVQVEHWPKVTGDRTVAVPPLFLLLLLPGDLLEECPASNAPSPCSPPAREAASPCTGIEEAGGHALDQSGDAEDTGRLPEG